MLLPVCNQKSLAMTDLLNMNVGQSRGRIKVYCRTRHFDAKDMLERGGCGVEYGGADHDKITLNYTRDDKSREASFAFDRVFSPDTTNTNASIKYVGG